MDVNIEKQFEESMNRNGATVICRECFGRMKYKAGGSYVCTECGHEELDDFGKVKKYIEKQGPANALLISRATGVPRAKVSQFLKDGRIQVLMRKNGKSICFCVMCGTKINSGDYCDDCLRELNGDLPNKADQEEGNKPPKSGKDNKMRFLGR